MPQNPVVSSREMHSRHTVLEIKGAAFLLGDRLVFPDTNWVIRQGENWAIVGPNGSGKSLFAVALRGGLPLVQGEVVWRKGGRIDFNAAEGIGLVSFDERHNSLASTVAQSRWNSLEEESTMLVRDFLSYEAVMEVNPFEVTDVHRQAKPAFERRRDRAVTLFEIQPLLSRPMLALSNGEHQRVQLAKGWCRARSMLVLDEPFQGLDPRARVEVRSIAAQLMCSTAPVLLLTTHVEELPAQITHVLRLEDCAVKAQGSRAAVLSRRGVRTSRSVREQRLPSSTKPVKGPRMPGKPLVEMHGVTVTYGGDAVLRDVDWTVREHESWALLGRNGSGKSTLLALIFGDHPQSYSNDICVFGRARGCGDSIWEIKRRIGLVSPELQVHFDGGVDCLQVVCSGFEETVGLFGRVAPARVRAARAWLGKVGLGDRANTAFGAISEGEQRLVLLARALVKKPTLLLLDEPCQGLDATSRRWVNATINHLIQSGGVTVVYVTHREEEIPTGIVRRLRLRNGSSSVR
jgi:molybdate transport system ATP-binding protein